MLASGAEREPPHGMNAARGTKRRANGRTEVKTYQPMPYDEVADAPSLIEVRVDETFTGDIEGDGSIWLDYAFA